MFINASLAGDNLRFMRYAIIQEAIEFHLEGLRAGGGEPIPPTNSHVEYVEVLAA